ncbi:MAG: hypothetical protein ABSF94_16100 [Steroidobacteraceae bacterium]|jgi:hypothetical protein
MISEWMKVMLDEIARKKADAEQAVAEELLRSPAQPETPKPIGGKAGERGTKADR